jgi:predicted O-methyltransferase YrrM
LSLLNNILPAIRFYLQAQTIYNVHSPFIFDFTSNILDDDRYFYAFDKLVRLRSKLLNDTSLVPMIDFGAGSHKGNAPHKQVRVLARTMLTSEYMGAILFKMVDHYRCKNIIELGTALGIGSLYMALAAPHSAKVYTIEGNPFLADLASHQFKQLEVSNITSVKGTFEDQLPEVLRQMKKVDLVYFDGHHQKEATLNYFQQCLPYTTENSIFVFDDINWSAGMQEAWAIIKAHQQVTYSVDLFRAGIVFFKKNLTGQEHVQMIQHRWKPWSAGFWD